MVGQCLQLCEKILERECLERERESPKMRIGIRGYMFHVNSDGLERN